MIGYLENRLSFLDKLYSPSNKEVYTPLALVNEMLDKLPEEVWDDTTLKWLNPAVKNGVFLGSIIFRLLNNYIEKGIFNTEQEAYNHIIQHQIYGYALSKGALRTANKLIYGSSKYNGNIIYNNILEEQIDMKFDVVIGNPPYQDPTTKKVQGSRKNPRKLWHDFIKKSNEISKYGGYISLITPPNFTQPTNKSSKEVMSKKDLYINMSTDIRKKVGVGIAMSYFIYKNEDNLEKKDVSFFDGKNNFNIPYVYGDMIALIDFSRIDQQICHKVLNNDLKKYDFKSNQKEIKSFKHLPIVKDNVYKYPIFDFQNIKYSDKKPSDINKPKVIISEFLSRRGGGYLLPNIYLDKHGEYGCWYKKKGGYIDFNSKNEAENIFHYLRYSNLMNFVFKHFSINSFMQSKVLESITVIDPTKKWTDQELYEYFNL
ncbi:MAG: Eco57I restriction-modification methylase domain-containing protein, partial [archaeon]